MKITYICILLGLLAGCKESTVRSKDITYIDRQDLKEIQHFNWTDLVDSCTYIPLETSDKILIGSVNELKVTDKHIILSDYSTNAISVFDRQGKFLTTIGSQGRGPQEYQHLAAFCVTPVNDTVIVYDGGMYRLQFYTIDNQYIKTIDLYKHLHRDSSVFRGINGIHYLESGKLLFNYSLMHMHNVAYSMYDYQRDSLHDIGFMHCKLAMPRAEATASISIPMVAHYQQHTSCCILFNDTIFQYQANALVPRIIVTAFQDEIVDDQAVRTQEGREITSAIRLLTRKGLYICNIRETEDYFIIVYCNQGMSKEIIWNKKVGKGLLINSTDYDGCTYSTGVWTISDIFDTEEGSILNQNSQMEALKPHLKEEDNPVIAIYHLKSDF